MRHLHVADIEVVVSEDRAAHRADQDGAVLYAEFVDGARDQLVHHAVAAAGAVVRLVLQLRLAFVDRVEGFGLFLVDDEAIHKLQT